MSAKATKIQDERPLWARFTMLGDFQGSREQAALPEQTEERKTDVVPSKAARMLFFWYLDFHKVSVVQN